MLKILSIILVVCSCVKAGVSVDGSLLSSDSYNVSISIPIIDTFNPIFNQSFATPSFNQTFEIPGFSPTKGILSSVVFDVNVTLYGSLVMRNYNDSVYYFEPGEEFAFVGTKFPGNVYDLNSSDMPTESINPGQEIVLFENENIYEDIYSCIFSSSKVVSEYIGEKVLPVTFYGIIDSNANLVSISSSDAYANIDCIVTYNYTVSEPAALSLLALGGLYLKRRR